TAAIDKNSRSRVHAHFRPQGERSIDGVLGSGGCGASSNLDWILPSLGLGVLQGGVRSGRRKPGLVFKQRIGKLEEGLVATRLGDTVSMGRRLEGLVVNLGEREILENKVSAGIVGQQLGDRGLRFLAVGALEVGELYNLQRFGGSALRRPVGSRLQNVPIALKRLGAEGQQRIGDQELAIGQGIESELCGLLFGATALDQNDHMTDSLSRRGQDSLNLPSSAGVVTPIGLEKFLHCLLGGRGISKVCRVNRGKRGRGFGGGKGGRRRNGRR